jgi:guanine deaminase
MSKFRCDAVVDQGRRDFFFRGAAAATMLAATGAATPVRAEATDKQKEFMAEANRLAVESVKKGWGGPFGAVIVKDGEIIGRGQNRVLLTGCPVYHAEVTAIMDASARLNPKPLMGSSYYDGILEMIPRPPGSPDVVASRAKMLKGCEIYVNGAPCPMCMSAIYWARIDHVFFGASLADATKAGFSDAFQYDDFKKPYQSRSIAITPGLEYESSQIAFTTWNNIPDRHYY